MNPLILFDNRFADAVPAASATASGYDVRHIADGRPYTFWQGDGPGTFYLSVNCGAAKAADALGIVGHNLGTAGATISVESSGNGQDWTERLAGFSPSDDLAILKTFPQASDLHWRLKIVTTAAAPRLGVVMLGVGLQFPFPPDTPYTPFTEDVEAETELSQAGHALGTVIRYRPVRVTARFSHLARNWVFGDFQAFWETHAAERRYFFWAWDLDEFPADVFYLRHRGAWRTPLSLLAVADSVALEMEGVRA